MSGFASGILRRGVSRFAASLAPAILYAIASCGGEATGSGGAGNVSAADFPKAAARAVCANVASCCTSSGRTFDDQTCEANVAKSFQSFSSFVMDGGGSYDPSQSGACLDALAAAARQCGEPLGVTSVCGRLFSASSSEPRGKLGDPCDCSQGSQSSDCFSTGSTADAGVLATCYAADGLFCEVSSAKCKPISNVGGPCPTGVFGPENAACNDSFCQNGICAPAAAEGAPCVPDSTACASGLFCDTTSGVCTRKKAEGQPCQSFDACQGTCTSGVCGAPSIVLLACAS